MIAAIELAMLARLKAIADAAAASPGGHFVWRTLTTYPDNWDAYLESHSEIRTPAAWVVFAGWNGTERGDDDVLRVNASFGLMIGDENLRPDEQYQRHGGADTVKEPGSYRLAEFAVCTLAGSDLGLDLVSPLEAGPMRPVRPTEAMTKRKLSLYAVEFTCRFPLITVDDEADAPVMEQLHANWDIPLFANPLPVDAAPGTPGIQLPDDAHADATDIVSLGDPD